MNRVARGAVLAAAALALLVILAGGAWFVSWGVLAPRAPVSGELSIAGLEHPVTVVRDARGIPYVRAASLHDAFEAQGYLEAQSRLFQMDVVRRFVAGRLAEIFGPGLLAIDVRHREIGMEALADRMYARARPDERLALDAYAQGVNAAIARGPLPVEFRVLLYRPRPWRPEDSLLCGMATVLDLTHTWNQILLRTRIDRAVGGAVGRALYAITDPRYDAPLSGRPAPVATMPPLAHPATMALDAQAAALLPLRHGNAEASNEWAVGGAHTRSGLALLANDPHLDYTVPQVWYAIGLRAPGLDVVGASLPGTPGVVLGHNAHLAWGATNGTVSTVTLYREQLRRLAGGGLAYLDPRTRRWLPATARRERIAVRGGRTRVIARYRTIHGFLLLTPDGRPTPYAAAWVTARDPQSPLAPFLALDRAANMGEALRALGSYPGPPQNFVLADDRGRVAYHLAGEIPIDGIWGTGVVDGSRVVDAWRGFVPFGELPHVDPSRDAVVFTANDRTYGAGYPYRLTDAFAPPYRAYRIRSQLVGRARLTVRKMERLQLDDLSLPERELVDDALAAARRRPALAGGPRGLALLRAWDGRFEGDSRAATLAIALRMQAERAFADRVLGASLGGAWLDDAGTEALVPLLRALRERPKGWFAGNGDGDALLLGALRAAERQTGMPPRPWRLAGATRLRHPLANLGITLFDPPSIPGWGDAFSVKVQTQAYGQSFRAVWEAGRWSEGGMSFPLGESGRPRTPHYEDQFATWARGTMTPLPLKERSGGRGLVVQQLAPERR